MASLLRRRASAGRLAVALLLLVPVAAVANAGTSVGVKSATASAAAEAPRLEGRFVLKRRDVRGVGVELTQGAHRVTYKFAPTCEVGGCRTKINRTRDEGMRVEYFVDWRRGAYRGSTSYLGPCFLDRGGSVRRAYDYGEKLVLRVERQYDGRVIDVKGTLLVTFEPTAVGRRHGCRKGLLEQSLRGSWGLPAGVGEPLVENVVPGAGPVDGRRLEVSWTNRVSPYAPVGTQLKHYNVAYVPHDCPDGCGQVEPDERAGTLAAPEVVFDNVPAGEWDLVIFVDDTNSARRVVTIPYVVERDTSVEITSPADGSTVTTSSIKLDLELADLSVFEPPREEPPGYVIVMADGEPAASFNAIGAADGYGLAATPEIDVDLGFLDPGQHTLEVYARPWWESSGFDGWVLAAAPLTIDYQP